MEQELKGVRTFLQKAAEKQGSKYDEAKADALIKSYNNDYGKLIADTSVKIACDLIEALDKKNKALSESDLINTK